jgi:hypothetical protein
LLAVSCLLFVVCCSLYDYDYDYDYDYHYYYDYYYDY